MIPILVALIVGAVGGWGWARWHYTRQHRAALASIRAMIRECRDAMNA